MRSWLAVLGHEVMTRERASGGREHECLCVCVCVCVSVFYARQPGLDGAGVVSWSGMLPLFVLHHVDRGRYCPQ